MYILGYNCTSTHVPHDMNMVVIALVYIHTTYCIWDMNLPYTVHYVNTNHAEILPEAFGFWITTMKPYPCVHFKSSFQS